MADNSFSYSPDQLDADAASAWQNANAPVAPRQPAPNAQALPSWYRSEAQEAADGGNAQSQTDPNNPAWLQRMDAQRASGAADNSAAPNPNAATPAWLQKMDAERGLPSWYTPEPPDPSSPTSDQPRGEDWGALAETALGQIPGVVAGVPRALTVDLPAYLAAKAVNLFGGHETAASMEARTEKAPHLLPTPADVLPSTEGVNNAVFNAVGAKQYQPVTPQGQVAQTALSTAGAATVDPLALTGDLSKMGSLGGALWQVLKNAAKGGMAGGAADVAHQVFPNSDVAPVAAALLTHGGTSAVGRAASGTTGTIADAARQVLTPTAQGEREAARTIANVDPSLPGPANPTDADVAAGRDNVANATNDIGPGLQPWQAGSQLRDDLQSRSDALTSTRSANADTNYANFRAQPALPATKLAPFAQRPGFQAALKNASASVLDEGGQPLTDILDFDDNGAPKFQPNAAVPADVLDRVKGHLDAAVNNAGYGTPAARTAGILRDQFVNFLDEQYPDSYGAARAQFATDSRPLDPLSSGPVGKVLDADRQYGKTTYSFPTERIPDLFLRSPATKTDLGNLVAAFGGDKTKALDALQSHLAGVAQTAVQSDGTLDAPAFDKAMQPYSKSLGGVDMWFPGLAQKFQTAKAAQSTLDTMTAQRGLTDAIRGGALRDNTGAITDTSFGKWLRANRDAVAKTQSPGAVMRLQSIANALHAPQGELAAALRTEVLPSAVGLGLGGSEGGVLGLLFHNTVGSAFKGLDAKRAEAFNAAIEKATLDPAEAAKLSAKMSSYGRLSPARALVRAAYATTLANNVAQMQKGGGGF